MDVTLGWREIRGLSGEESDWIGGSAGVGTEYVSGWKSDSAGNPVVPRRNRLFLEFARAGHCCVGRYLCRSILGEVMSKRGCLPGMSPFLVHRHRRYLDRRVFVVLNSEFASSGWGRIVPVADAAQWQIGV